MFPERQTYDFNAIKWEDFFLQKGRGPKFIGMPYQRGRGLGAIFASLASLLPTFLNSDIGKQIVETGKSVVKDVKEGETVKDAAKKEGRALIKRLTGVGKRKGPNRKPPVIVQRKGAKRRLPLFVPV